ncbi:glycosyltransferase family 4 protein [Autumnicola edwardsiae]|uniref:Glycosyltransferase family 4 protein n=1 Tax=Autumnicola edwardsiae TaxID=3075594 RepID=A0ABU3CTF1_9FLAO|nr:glycosyltransferase family 4 protein [Zunongwangia sp. F297]MDT0649635.1 glycosyltransferase family 4 protein [Zunongwangia sp. F297]
MKVFVLINSLGAGGAERSMVEFAKFLFQQNSITIKFVCLERRKIGLEEEVASVGIPVIFYAGKNSYYSKIIFLNELINKENPDIVHSVLTQSNLVARGIRIKNRKIKIIQSLVNTPYSVERKKDAKLPWYKSQIAKQLDIWSARFSKNIFYHSITHEVLEHYKPLFHIKENYKIIHRGRYENSYSGSVKKADEFLIVNSGRQEFAKGQIDILKALKHLRDSKGVSDINFMLLGRPGHYTEILEDFVKKNHLENQVNFPGFVDDVEKRLATAHAFVFPSYYEGLGGALIEAFSARLPCACSNIPVLKEVVGDEKGALFSAPGDFEALAENILKLYKDKKLREELGQYSYQRFQQSFRMEKINKEMLAMYKSLLKH